METPELPLETGQVCCHWRGRGRGSTISPVSDALFFLTLQDPDHESPFPLFLLKGSDAFIYTKLYMTEKTPIGLFSVCTAQIYFLSLSVPGRLTAEDHIT